jgi:hypothetical protein
MARFAAISLPSQENIRMMFYLQHRRILACVIMHPFANFIRNITSTACFPAMAKITPRKIAFAARSGLLHIPMASGLSRDGRSPAI